MMDFEMSLPHAKRVKQLDGQGKEELAPDQDLWDLHGVVHRAIQDKATAAAAAGQEQGEEEPTRRPAVPNPQRVLEKLLTARGEVDVIVDLVGFVEAQQFVGVAHLPRKPNTLEDLTRDRALRVGRRREQLRACATRMENGLAALRAQAEVSGRFVEQVAQLRKRWRLKRHGGKEGLFYADLSLPLTAAARKAVGEQPGSQWNLLQDTNGDVCMVEKGPDGRPRAVRGPAGIHASLAARQRVLTWHVARQLLAQQAQQAQQAGTDPDGLTPIVLQLAEGEKARCERAAAAAAAAAAKSSAAMGRQDGGSGPSAMDLDLDLDVDTPLPGAGALPETETANGAAGTAGTAWGSMQSGAAADAQALLRAPGFQAQFAARALQLLRGYLRGPLREAGALDGPGAVAAPIGARGSQDGPWAPPLAAAAAGRGSGGGSGGGSGVGGEGGGTMLDALLGWLRHRAASHRVEAALLRQVERHNAALADQRGGGSGGGSGAQEAPGGGVGQLSLQRIESGAELVDVWQLAAAAAGAGAGTALVVACEGAVRLEGLLRQPKPGAGPPAGACRPVGRSEVDELVALALGGC